MLEDQLGHTRRCVLTSALLLVPSVYSGVYASNAVRVEKISFTVATLAGATELSAPTALNLRASQPRVARAIHRCTSISDLRRL